MIVFIGGSRTITDYDEAEIILNAIWWDYFHRDTIEKIISGGAGGVDTIAEQWANEHSISFHKEEADWQNCAKSCKPTHRRFSTITGETYCPTAGLRRNRKCAAMIDAYIGLWDGESRGTVDMAKLCLDRPVPVYLVTLRR